MQIYLAFDGGLVVLKGRDGAWHPTLALAGEECQCLAVDPHDERRALLRHVHVRAVAQRRRRRNLDTGAGRCPTPMSWPWPSVRWRPWPATACSGPHRAERASTVPRTAAQPGPK
ncbi:MAG: hypothetical protein R3A10_19515 [Caldilineaceae bacterium]